MWRAMADRAEAGMIQVDGVLPWINCNDPLVEFPGRISCARGVAFHSSQGQVKSSQLEGECAVWWRTSPHVFVSCSGTRHR